MCLPTRKPIIKATKPTSQNSKKNENKIIITTKRISHVQKAHVKLSAVCVSLIPSKLNKVILAIKRIVLVLFLFLSVPNVEN